MNLEYCSYEFAKLVRFLVVSASLFCPRLSINEITACWTGRAISFRTTRFALIVLWPILTCDGNFSPGCRRCFWQRSRRSLRSCVASNGDDVAIFWYLGYLLYRRSSDAVFRACSHVGREVRRNQRNVNDKTKKEREKERNRVEAKGVGGKGRRMSSAGRG